MTNHRPCDLLIIGGGVNGAGIARDAAGRELDVVLVEQADLAQHASSSSTKLIHGGLRYLEHFEFRLVREALRECELLLELAPHLVRPLDFLIPHQAPFARPAWVMRLGLLLYDHIARRRSLRKSRSLRVHGSVLGHGLKETVRRAFVYSDCKVDDSRLVVLNAVDAAERGATIYTRTRLIEAHRLGGYWYATVENVHSGAQQLIRARAIVNSSGPWVSSILTNCLGVREARSIRLVKGSHIVVPSLYEGDHALLLQNADGRVVFAIPFGLHNTLIGTTEIAIASREPPGSVNISENETAYLTTVANHYFASQITAADVIWSFAGIRPLYDDCASDLSAISRDYVIDVDAPSGMAPVISVYGGKITTYRRVAEQVLRRIVPYLNKADAPWTHLVALPGGVLPPSGLAGYIEYLASTKPQLPRDLIARLAHAYGSRAGLIIGSAFSTSDLGAHFGADLYQSEVDYLIDHEWAQFSDDILWRRSKLGLSVSHQATLQLSQYLDTRFIGGGRSASATPRDCIRPSLRAAALDTARNCDG